MEIKTIIDSLKYCSVNGSICRECPNYNQGSGCLDRLHAAAADLLESQQKRIADLEEKNRWIPVTERLPGTECLAISMIPGKPFYKEQLVGYIGECGRSESGYMCESDDQMLMNVTHWKCPEPPKEGT